MWQERRGTRRQGVATELGPVDFAAIARACGARGVRVERDAEFEPALRAALAADRPTVIQLALDQRLGVDRPAARLMRETFHLVPARSGPPRIRRAPYEATSLATRASSTARTASRRSSRRSTATTPPTRGTFLALTLDLDALDVPWRYDDPGSPYPHIYGPIDRAGDRRGRSVERAPDGRFAGLSPA